MPCSHEVAAIGTTTATEQKSYGGVGRPKNAESATEHRTTATRFTFRSLAPRNSGLDVRKSLLK
jgi:hypothetical protein